MLLQVISGPQAGVTGADDGDIGVGVPRHPAPRLQRFPHGVMPEGERAVIGHLLFGLVQMRRKAPGATQGVDQ